MIDQCILDVYLRDKKVFLPDFGAIIYSDFNDSIDFNDLLTFDDGKVVEEIQMRLSLPEEEARKSLEEYVHAIKDTLGKGKLHYFTGIGYLSKDNSGNFFIERSKPVEQSPSGDEDEIKAIEEESNAAEIKPEEPKIEEVPPIIPEERSDFAVESETEVEPVTGGIDIELEPQEGDYIGEETEFEVDDKDTFGSFSSDDDNYHEYDAEEPIRKKSKSPQKAIWIAFIVITLTVGGFYLYKLFFLSDGAEKQELLLSENNDSKETAESTTKIVANEVIGDNAPAVSSSSQHSIASENTSVSEKEDDEKKTFSLIFGGFKEERNADKYLRKLRAKGYEVDKFKGLHQLYFVGIEKIYGKSNAVKQLEGIRQKEPQAWIYNRGLLPNP